MRVEPAARLLGNAYQLVLPQVRHGGDVGHEPFALLDFAFKRIKLHVGGMAHCSKGVIVALVSYSSPPNLLVGVGGLYTLILRAVVLESSKARAFVRQIQESTVSECHRSTPLAVRDSPQTHRYIQ